MLVFCPNCNTCQTCSVISRPYRFYHISTPYFICHKLLMKLLHTSYIVSETVTILTLTICLRLSTACWNHKYNKNLLLHPKTQMETCTLLGTWSNHLTLRWNVIIDFFISACCDDADILVM